MFEMSKNRNELQDIDKERKRASTIMNPIYRVMSNNDVRIYQNKCPLDHSISNVRYNKRILNTDSSLQNKYVVQRYIEMKAPYRGDYKIIWDNTNEEKEFWETVDSGMRTAIERLNIVIAKTKRENISKYASEVLAVLSDDKLIIYPMADEGIMGKAGCGEKAISLDVNEHRGNSHEVSKTLIHEAFHIIGGCWKINKDGEHECDETLDVANNETDPQNILLQIDKDDRENICADAFAQYVMVFEPSRA